MRENRLPDYINHIQQAVILSLIIIGEAATRVMDGYAEFAQAHTYSPGN